MRRQPGKIFIIFVLLLLGAVPLSFASDSKKTKIAVVDFQMQGERFETSDMGRIVAEWLITCLVETGRFDVIERRLIEKVIEEQKVGASGLISAEGAAEVGKMLGAKNIITGTVLSLGKRFEINARLISVEEGSIITAVNIIADSESKLRPKVSERGEKIINAFPLEGYILKRTKDKVVIDLGRPAGVKEGMRFVVIKEGSAIRHPKTGEIVDVEEIEAGEVEMEDVGKKTSTGFIRKESRSGKIEDGMAVRSISQRQEVTLPDEAPKPTIPLPGL